MWGPFHGCPCKRSCLRAIAAPLMLGSCHQVYGSGGFSFFCGFGRAARVLLALPLSHFMDDIYRYTISHKRMQTFICFFLVWGWVSSIGPYSETVYTGYIRNSRLGIHPCYGPTVLILETLKAALTGWPIVVPCTAASRVRRVFRRVLT